MSFEEADALIGDYTGSGTAEDPYSGLFQSETEFDLLNHFNGAYFTIGSTFVNCNVYTPDWTDVSVKIDDDFGLSLNLGKVTTLSGTLKRTGDFHWYVTDSNDNTMEYVIHVVEMPITELKFVSNPIEDGVIEYVA